MHRETGSPKIVDWKLIIPELRVLVLTRRHLGSGNEIVTGIIQANLIHLSIKMTMPHQSGAPFLGKQVFQKRGVCRQAFPFFPSPTPFLPSFCSCPIFRVAWMLKLPLRGPNFVRFVQECLPRRLISSIPNFCKKKSYLEWYPDQSDQLNGAWDMHQNAQKFEWKTQSKISCDYTWLLHGENDYAFSEFFGTGSKPSRISITCAAAKR